MTAWVWLLVTGSPVFGIDPGSSPSIFSVVATQDATTVTIKFSSNTLAGTGISAYTPGHQDQFTLNRGDVLQIAGSWPSTCSKWVTDKSGGFSHCDTGVAYDVTGSYINANKPVAVFSGHNCAYVPFNVQACDHIEEQMFPVETWGNHYILTNSKPIQNPAEPNLYRVISGFAGNKITFTPTSIHADITLDKGQWFEVSTTTDFEVKGTLGFAVGQYMTGENYNGTPTVDSGDPSLSNGVPVEQYRTFYNFLTPTTYTQSYVNITAPAGTTVTLDGAAVGGFAAVGSGAYTVAKVLLQPGQHTITSNLPVGIVVYGFGSYTSYMFPGGLNLLPLNE